GQISHGFDDFSRPTQIEFADGSSLENHYFQDFYRPSQVWLTHDPSSSEDVFYLTYHPSDRDLITSVFGPKNGILFEYDPPLLTRTEFQTQSVSGVITMTYDDFLRMSELH